MLRITPVILLLFSISVSQENRYDDYFRKYSKRFFSVAFDWKLFKAQAKAESNLCDSAKSWVGARGIMQLMPGTFLEIQSKNPEFVDISDPGWNIAAGIFYDRKLWNAWKSLDSTHNRLSFMFASYNAGSRTINRAQDTASSKNLDTTTWNSITCIAPIVPRWRYKETVTYIEKIEQNYSKYSKNEKGFKALP